MKRCYWKSVLFALLSCVFVPSSMAATNTVQIVNFSFQPSEVTINVGDTVVWRQVDSIPHNSASDTGLWRGPLMSPGQTFSRVFSQAGTFPYHCDPHPDMLGTVIVRAAANTPPNVSLTQPTNNATFTAPANILLQANAADADGSVSQVEFFNGAASLGVDMTIPYSINATFAAGTHTLAARATDNAGATTTSSAITITVTAANTPPTVAITSPANATTFPAPANVTIEANAADADGAVIQVEFFDGATSLGVDTTSPYSFTAALASGSHTLTARATDNAGATTTSAPVTVTVNAPNLPPSISITAPANGASFTAPATINVSAIAADNDGLVTQVEFFDGAASLGVDTSIPFGLSGVTLTAGTHTLTARATDDAGASTTSAAITVTVTAPNMPPSVAISSPTNAATFLAPASITVEVTAADADGTVADVELLDGGTSLGIDSTAPFSFAITLGVGAHTLTARARDNSGVATVSDPITLTVNPPNVPPSVAITNPADGATFMTMAPVMIGATATDSDGGIAMVEFFAGRTLLGMAMNAPFSLTVTNLPLGQHTLTAKATDDAGAATTSEPVTITIQAPPTVRATLTSPLLTANGQFQFILNGTAAQTYVIQVSTNLVEWAPTLTNTMTSATRAIAVPAAADGAHRFYRAVEQ